MTAMCSDTILNSLYVGGSYDTSGTVPTSNISRWDGNYWNPVGTGLTGIVMDLEFYNGELYVGCDNGAAPGNIFKWDGINWTMPGGGTNGWVSATAVYNGELYVGGAFDTAGIVAANYIAKWDGSTWSALGTGMNDAVEALIVYNGELYAGGRFTLAGGNVADGIAKWDGNTWASVGSNSTGRWVYSFGIYNGELYEGATSSGGSAEITKWDGSNWVGVDGGVQGALGSWVSSMLVYNNELYVGGTFLYAGTTLIPVNGIAKWNGTNWSAVGNGMDYGVFALDTLNGLLYAGGFFINADGNPAEHIAVWPTPVGINEIAVEFPSVQISPVPCDEVIHFDFSETGIRHWIMISDQTGRVVLQIQSAAEKTQVYVLELEEGMYYYSIQHENGDLETGKFIVIHR